MASGTITSTKTSSTLNYIETKIEWTSSADHDANESDVTAKLYVRKGHHDMILTIPTSGTWSYSLILNGTASAVGSKSLDVLDSWVLVATKTLSGVAHNGDGTKSISITSSVNAPNGTTLAGHNSKISKTVSLDTIPRATEVNSVKCSTAYLDGVIEISYTPKNAAHYNRQSVYLNHGGVLRTIRTTSLGKKSAAVQTSSVLFSEDELSDKIYAVVTKSTSAKLRIAFNTYSDSDYTKKVGDTKFKEITLSIPTSVKPTASLSAAAVNTNAWIKSKGLYVAGYSQVKLTLTAKPGDGANISSQTISGDDFSVNGTTVTADIASHGSFTFIGKVTDSRGRSATSDDRKITVLPYFPPAVTSLKVERGTYSSGWTASENGPDIRVLFKVGLELVDNGNTYNAAFNLDGKATAPDYGTTSGLESGASRAGYFYDVDSEVSHALTLTVTDGVGVSANAGITILSKNVTIEFNQSGKGIAFGKTSEKDAFECAWPAYFLDNIKVESGTTNKVIENRRITPPDATDDEHKDVRMQLYVGDSGFPSCRNQYSTDGGGNWITRSYWRLQDDGLYANGHRIPEIQHGNVSIVPSAANTPTGLAVTFDKSFSGPPDIIASSHTSVPGTTVVGVGTSSRSPTGCMIYVTRTNTTATTVNWIAIY